MTTREERLAQEVSVTLSFHDWVLLNSLINCIIEKTLPLTDRTASEQTLQLSRIREIIDRATD